MDMDLDIDLKTFTLYWHNGRREIVHGTDMANAMIVAGYGKAAVRALDFCAHGENYDYEWDAKKRDWVRITPMVTSDNLASSREASKPNVMLCARRRKSLPKKKP